MINKLLQELEEAICQTNPILGGRLRHGLSEPTIRKMLSKAGVHGYIEPILLLYHWKDGCIIDPSIARYISPFPDSKFFFEELIMMIVHFKDFEECARYNPKYEDVVGKIFPVFWDGSSRWLGVDLTSEGCGRVMLIDGDKDEILCLVENSFEGFLQNTIRCIRSGNKLAFESS